MDEKSNSAETTPRIKKILNAPRESVFRAWCEPEVLKARFAPTDQHTALAVKEDLKVGGKYTITLRSPQGKISRAGGAYRKSGLLSSLYSHGPGKGKISAKPS